MTTLLICGSRDASDVMLKCASNAVLRARANEWSIIVGDAEGVDNAAVTACLYHKIECDIYGIAPHPRNIRGLLPDYMRYHQISGDYLTRDRVMVEAADACFAIWNGVSRGTIYTYNYAVKLGKQAWLRTWATRCRAALAAIAPSSTATEPSDAAAKSDAAMFDEMLQDWHLASDDMDSAIAAEALADFVYDHAAAIRAAIAGNVPLRVGDSAVVLAGYRDWWMTQHDISEQFAAWQGELVKVFGINGDMALVMIDRLPSVLADVPLSLLRRLDGGGVQR